MNKKIIALVLGIGLIIPSAYPNLTYAEDNDYEEMIEEVKRMNQQTDGSPSPVAELETLNEMIEYAKKVEKLPEYKNILQVQKSWLDAAIFRAMMVPGSYDLAERKYYIEASSDLYAELTRADLEPLFNKVLKKEISFYAYLDNEPESSKKTHEQVIIADRVVNHPAYKNLPKDIRDRLKTATDEVSFRLKETIVGGSTDWFEVLYETLKRDDVRQIVGTLGMDIKYNKELYPEASQEVPDNNKKYEDLKQAAHKLSIQIDAAINIIENYPKTIAGEEAKLIKMLQSAHDKLEKAAFILKEDLGETLEVKPLNIPEKYQSLV